MALSLANVSRGARNKPPRIVLYGVDGIGKTTFASEAPNPIFLFTEPGQGNLDVASFTSPAPDPFNPDNTSNVLRTWPEIIEAITALYTEVHDFQTVVLDTLDAAEPLLHRYVAQQHGKADIEAFGYGKGYVFAAEEARNMLAGLDALCNDRNMSVIVLAHSQVKRYEAPEHEAYDRYQMRVQEKLAAIVSYWADAVLFSNYRVHIVADKSKRSDNETKRGVGIGERFMFTQERPAWHAKNRYGLPPEIPMPKGSAWNNLVNAFAAGVQASQSVQQHVQQPTQQPIPQPA